MPEARARSVQGRASFRTSVSVLGRIKVQSLDFSDVVIRATGPVAVVTGKSTVRESHKGEDRSGDQRFTRVYVKRDGRWLLWIYQLTRVSAAP